MYSLIRSEVVSEVSLGGQCGVRADNTHTVWRRPRRHRRSCREHAISKAAVGMIEARASEWTTTFDVDSSSSDFISSRIFALVVFVSQYTLYFALISARSRYIIVYPAVSSLCGRRLRHRAPRIATHRRLKRMDSSTANSNTKRRLRHPSHDNAPQLYQGYCLRSFPYAEK